MTSYFLGLNQKYVFFSENAVTQIAINIKSISLIHKVENELAYQTAISDFPNLGNVEKYSMKHVIDKFFTVFNIRKGVV